MIFQAEELVVNKPNILDQRPVGGQAAAGGAARAPAAAGAAAPAPEVDVRKLTVNIKSRNLLKEPL